MDKLYEEYGKLAIQFEVIQGKLNEAKRKIAQALDQGQAKVKQVEAGDADSKA